MQNANLSLVRGDDQDVGMTVLTASGTPYNLSGCVLAFQARQTTYFSPLILEKQASMHLDATGGLSQLTFIPADTNGIDDLDHYYDIKLQSAAGKINTLVYGIFTVQPK